MVTEEEIEKLRKEIIQAAGRQADKEIKKIKQDLIENLEERKEIIYKQNEAELTEGVRNIIGNNMGGVEIKEEKKTELDKAAMCVKAIIYDKIDSLINELRETFGMRRAGSVLK